MLDCILVLLQKYQILAAGIVGFTGVIITILMNSKISRDQHLRDVKHKANSLRTALFTELSLLADSYRLRIEQLNDMDGRSALINEYNSNRVYSEMLPQLGLLSKLEIEKVMTAHQLNNELPFRLGLYTGDLELSQQQKYVRVTEDKAKVVAQVHSEFLKVIDAALNELENNLEQ